MPESYKEKYRKLKIDYDEGKKKHDILRQLLSVAQSRCRTLNEEISQLLDLIMESQSFSDSSDSDTSLSSFNDSSDSESSKDTSINNSKLIKNFNDNVFKKRRNSEKYFDSDLSKSVNDDIVPKKKRRKSSKRDTRFDAKPIKLLPRDKNGNLILPVTVGKSSNEVTIISIGKIVYERDAYHSQRYIWPVGFESKKEYISMQDPKKRTIYTNRILDGGDVPIFEVTAEDLPGTVFRANSASGAWKSVLSELSRRGSTGAKTHASGPDFFGLSDLGVTKVIQELPNAERCIRYVKQRWIQDEDNENADEENRISGKTTDKKSLDEEKIEDEEKITEENKTIDDDKTLDNDKTLDDIKIIEEPEEEEEDDDDDDDDGDGDGDDESN